MLVVLAVASALLFYAAELGPAGLARFLGLDKAIEDRFGDVGTAVTSTVASAMTEPADSGFPTSMPSFSLEPTFALPATPINFAVPTLTFQTSTPTATVNPQSWPTPEPLASPTSPAPVKPDRTPTLEPTFGATAYPGPGQFGVRATSTPGATPSTEPGED
jgi:hypothetical protein